MKRTMTILLLCGCVAGCGRRQESTTTTPARQSATVSQQRSTTIADLDKVYAAHVSDWTDVQKKAHWQQWHGAEVTTTGVVQEVFDNAGGILHLRCRDIKSPLFAYRVDTIVKLGGRQGDTLSLLKKGQQVAVEAAFDNYLQDSETYELINGRIVQH